MLCVLWRSRKRHTSSDPKFVTWNKTCTCSHAFCSCTVDFNKFCNAQILVCGHCYVSLSTMLCPASHYALNAFSFSLLLSPFYSFLSSSWSFYYSFNLVLSISFSLTPSIYPQPGFAHPSSDRRFRSFSVTHSLKVCACFLISRTLLRCEQDSARRTSGISFSLFLYLSLSLPSSLVDIAVRSNRARYSEGSTDYKGLPVVFPVIHCMRPPYPNSLVDKLTTSYITLTWNSLHYLLIL